LKAVQKGDVPETTRSEATKENVRPRGSGGCVLCPGTVVRINGLRGESTRVLNGQEGVCEWWDNERGLMSVRLRSGGGAVKAISNKHLRKVCLKEADALGPEARRMLEIFQQYDTDGDGLIDVGEFTGMIVSLGMGTGVVAQFLGSCDKDGDCQIMYEEFLEWALTPVRAHKTRAELFFPEKRTTVVQEVVEEDEGAADDDDELTLEDVEGFCKGSLPVGWPSHGLAVLNNMHARFPDYPVAGIVFMMTRNDFIGGKVLAAIRATGTPESDMMRAGAIKVSGAFPAMYQNVSGSGALPVFEEGSRGWSFHNMRDNKMNKVGRIERGEHFQVLEVRRGSEYSFCFGRIKWSVGRNYWVVLGLEAHADWRPDRKTDAKDMSFSDALRLEGFPCR